MWKQYSGLAGRLVLVTAIALVMFFSGRWQAERAVPEAGAAPVPLLRTQVFDVNCTSLAAITPEYAKLLDMGEFTSDSADSIHELTFNGRIYVNSFASGTGAVFELRVDDLPTDAGRARANLRITEAGGGGQPVSITGIFSGLAPGPHTASMWVRTSTGGAGTQALVDPGCWNTDVLIVKEHLPFGTTYLPSLQSAGE